MTRKGNSMTDSKSWYRSKTIWGAAITLAAAVAGLLGVKIDAATGADLAAAIPDAVAGVGAVIAIIGRLDAKSTIG